MDIKKLEDLKNKRIHFIGIGGVSMSALAQMLLKEKMYIQGSDECENNEIKKLENLGVKIYLKHDKNNLKGIDIVIFSSAIKEDNEELVFAKNSNLTILKRAQLLALIAGEYKTVISIAGSHGKTTTTAMIAEMFLNAKLNPTIHLGGILNSIDSNYVLGDKNFFITESCEYKDNFLYLHPDLSVVLNIDADHLDYFKNIDGVKKSFLRFASNTNSEGLNIVCGDDINSCELLKNANTISYGCKNSNLTAKNIIKIKNNQFSFDVYFQSFKLGNIKLNIPGRHNIYNALATIMVGLLCNIDFCDIKKSIEGFSGTRRRTEFICQFSGAYVYHDYAHHPSQINRMIDIGRDLALEKGSCFYVVYEPHTFSRTKYLLDEFATSFKGVDEVVFAPVYSAREKLSDGFDSNILQLAVSKKGIKSILLEDYKQIFDWLKLNIKENDIVFILGAGSIDKLAKMIKEEND